MRRQELVVERHPVEHLIEQAQVTAADTDGEQAEGILQDRPVPRRRILPVTNEVNGADQGF
jgi:hypothetical protein